MNVFEKLIYNKYGMYGGYLFYRCRGCQKILTKLDIKAAGCKCGFGQMSPTNLTFLEELQMILGALWK